MPGLTPKSSRAPASARTSDATRGTTPLEPILRAFTELSAIPRCSGKEEGVRAWLMEWAAARGLAAAKDSAGNVRIDVPPSPGAEDSPGVILQAHQDMVCEKNEDVAHDFSRDPITPVRQGDWLTANGTTLGADNGAGVALALGIVDFGLKKNPPLELLFTANEEAGMSGARGLDARFVRGRRMINLDSEDEGVFTIGCAGNRGVEVSLPVGRQKLSDDPVRLFRMRITGLRGGHSATDISRDIGNANVLLARLVRFCRDRTSMMVLSFDGGNAMNAIAREAAAIVAIPATQQEELEKIVRGASERFAAELHAGDGAVRVALEPPADDGNAPRFDAAAFIREGAIPPDAVTRACELVLALPHGVHRLFDNPDHGVVETSCNLAATKLDGKTFRIRLSIRSAFKEHGDELEKKLRAIADLAGGSTAGLGGYEPWRTREDSYLVARCPEAYSTILGASPRVEIAHGGLECGIISASIPEMDIVSIGPTIEGAHSPAERVLIPSLEKTGRYLLGFLELEAG